MPIAGCGINGGQAASARSEMSVHRPQGHASLLGEELPLGGLLLVLRLVAGARFGRQTNGQTHLILDL